MRDRPKLMVSNMAHTAHIAIGKNGQNQLDISGLAMPMRSISI